MSKFNRFGGARVSKVAGLTLAATVVAGCASHAPALAPSAPSPTTATANPPATLVIDEPAQATPTALAPAAPGVSLRPNAPLRYVVKRGDTLWDIAGYYLRAPWQWPALWYDNPQIKNPHLIYPGDVLKLSWVNGQPRLTRASGTERLEPRVHSLPLEQATPSIPFAAIRDFLNGPRVVDADQIQRAPYVVAFVGGHLIGSAGVGVFVKNLPKSHRVNWEIVHIGKPYHDADSGELLGYEAIPTARAQLRKFGAPALLGITKSDRETQAGDRLLPVAAEEFRPRFVPHAPPRPVDGSIIAVFGGVTEVGQHAIVTLDRGSNAGLDAGTVLRILQAPRDVPDPYGGADATVTLPPQPAGLLMVFQAEPRLSYALVMDETLPVHVRDRVAAPSLRQPDAPVAAN